MILAAFQKKAREAGIAVATTRRVVATVSCSVRHGNEKDTIQMNTSVCKERIAGKTRWLMKMQPPNVVERPLTQGLARALRAISWPKYWRVRHRAAA